MVIVAESQHVFGKPGSWEEAQNGMGNWVSIVLSSSDMKKLM